MTDSTLAAPRRPNRWPARIATAVGALIVAAYAFTHIGEPPALSVTGEGLAGFIGYAMATLLFSGIIIPGLVWLPLWFLFVRPARVNDDRYFAVLVIAGVLATLPAALFIALARGAGGQGLAGIGG